MVAIMKRRVLIWCYGSTTLVVALIGIRSCYRACYAPREMPHDEVCRRNLTYLGIATTRYRNDTGDLPHDVKSSTGFTESWRLRLIPYYHGIMELGKPLDYRCEEPWDSPHNLDKAERVCLLFYSCWVKWPREERPFATYVMLIRPDRQGPNGAMSLPDDAVLVVESAGCGIGCFEPKDLHWDDLWKGDSPFGVGKLNSRHADYVRALRVDGEVIEIRKDISKEDLRKLLNGTTRD